MESSFIGTGRRWRHQLAAGPLGPNGEVEIWEIQTPHIGGIAQTHRLLNGALDRVAMESIARTSHDIGSRNLYTAIVADFDGDGQPDLLVRNQEKTALVGLQRSDCEPDGWQQAWLYPLISPLASNIAVVCTREESQIIASCKMATS